MYQRAPPTVYLQPEDPGRRGVRAFTGIRRLGPGYRNPRVNAPGRDNSAGTQHFPLARAGITRADVLRCWSQQPFDLALDWLGDLGNCDLWFLTGRRKLVRALRGDPAHAVRCRAQEARSGQRFLSGFVSYGELLREAEFMGRQLELEAIVDAGRTVGAATELFQVLG